MEFTNEDIKIMLGENFQYVKESFLSEEDLDKAWHIDLAHKKLGTKESFMRQFTCNPPLKVSMEKEGEMKSREFPNPSKQDEYVYITDDKKNVFNVKMTEDSEETQCTVTFAFVLKSDIQ